MRSAAVVVISATLLLGLAAVQDPRPAVRAPDPDALRRAHELAQPTDHHARLRRLAGRWDVTLRTNSPDGTHEDRGTAAGELMLGGRYVVLSFELQLSGHELQAVQIVGFDTMRSVYTASWRDTASTWPVRCEGEPADGDAADLLTMRGSLVDARSPRGRPFRLVMDLRERERVGVKVFEGFEADEVVLQEQEWRRAR